MEDKRVFHARSAATYNETDTIFSTTQSKMNQLFLLHINPVAIAPSLSNITVQNLNDRVNLSLKQHTSAIREVG